MRILNLLAEDDAHLTKFELGNKLGFIGEAGFTSLPQSVFLRALASIEDPVEANKMKSDWEGSSDKYARMIAKWLSKLGLVEMKPKNFLVETKKGIKEVVIGQAYQITAKGIKALKYTTGKSSYRRMKKNVCYEMLATKSGDREYLRSRRSYILKYLSEGKGLIKDTELLNYLQKNQIRCNLESIRDDIKGLINIGLSIKQSEEGYLFLDEINDFIIPKMEKIIVSENEDLKEELRSKLTHLSHEYLSLLDLAYDSKQNRLFEFKVLQLLTEECGFHGFHLGGSRKPDGIISSPGLYGVIIDTKAYSKGYSLPISQADEMERYIGENQSRDEKINPNRWWNNFDSDLVTYHYMFVAGHFKGKYQEQIQRVNYNKKVTGAAVSVKELLLLANDYKAKKVSHQDIEQILFQGKGA